MAIVQLLIITVSVFYAQTGSPVPGAELKGTTGPERLKLLEKLMDFYSGKDFDKARLFGEEALKMVSRFPNIIDEAGLLVKMIRIHNKLGNYSTAFAYANRAEQVAIKSGNMIVLADSYIFKGSACNFISNYSLSLLNYDKACNILVRMKDDARLADCYNGIGMVYRRMGDFPTALTFFLKAGALYDKLDDKKSHGNLYNSIGLIYKKMGNLDKALENFQKFLKIAEIQHDTENIAVAQDNIGNIYDLQGKSAESLDLLKKSLAAFEKLGLKKGISDALDSLGEYYMRRGSHALALDYYGKAIKIKENIKEDYSNILSLISMSQLYRKMGQFPAAFSHLTRALAIAEKTKSRAFIPDIYLQLSYLYEEIKDYRKSLDFYKKHKEFTDLLFNENNTRRLNELNTRFDTERKEKEISLLKKDQQIQRLNLSHQENITRFLLIISAMVIILVVVIYRRYRLKIRINNRLQMEIAARKNAEEELVRIRKTEAFGLLAAGISHDFNNLLAVITGYIGLVKDSFSDPGSQAEQYIAQAETATFQATELVKKFLSLSAFEWSPYAPVNLENLLQSLTDSCPKLKDIPFHLETPLEIKSVYGNKHQLDQVMENLITNAYEALDLSSIAFFPSGDMPIRIQTKVVSMEQENSQKLTPGEYVKISVIDRGKGIPPEIMDKIYDPYFSTKERGAQKGMGLGLSMCYAIIKRHKGCLVLSSMPYEPDSLMGGTTVDIYLPIVKPT